MTKIFFILSLASLLTACGNGNNDQAVVGTYGYGQNGYSTPGSCPASTALDWNALIASRCGNRNGQAINDGCSQGVAIFRQRNAAAIQGPGCAVATTQMQWCPGNNGQGQSSFQINEGVLNAISTQNGPGSWPANGGQVMPGQGGVYQGNGF